MSSQPNKTIFASCLFLLLLAVVGILPAGAATDQAILPEGLVMEDVYSPGRGRSIGRIQRIDGRAVVMHGDLLTGYYAERGMRLYKGDTIFTLEEAKLRFRLNDGSILSLASETKLTLNQSVIDRQKKQRSSFLSMALGKARYFVVKLLDYKRSEFRVKTPTAVCGVRGSDFILEVTATETTATALKDTVLEIKSLAFPDEAPIVLTDGETSTVVDGMRPTEPVRLSPEAIERKQQFFFDVMPEDETGRLGEEEDLRGRTADDTGVDDVGPLGGEELDLEVMEMPSRLPLVRGFISAPQEEKILPVPDPPRIKETILEESITGVLPDFPSNP